MPAWKAIKSAPKDGTKVDLWLSVRASPRSMGMSDAFRVIDCWQRDGKWFYYHEGKEAELFGDYITHWAAITEPAS